MRKLYSFSFFIMFCFSFALSLSSASRAENLWIATGNIGGTWYEMGVNMKGCVRKYGINLRVQNTAGSFDNLQKLRENPKIKLAIVQEDVIGDELSDTKQQNSQYADLRLVLPLHYSELHILAKTNIRKLTDLNNKRVSIGPRDSGVYNTATALLTHVGDDVLFKEFNYPLKTAFEKLRKGEIDAMFFVGGQPVPEFTDLADADKLHFIPIDLPKFTKGRYKATVLKKSNYKWMDNDVKTISVRNVIVTHGNYESSKSTTCKNIRKLTQAIQSNLSCLKSIGHVKWAEVQPEQAYLIPGWKNSSCTYKKEKAGCGGEDNCGKCEALKNGRQRLNCYDCRSRHEKWVRRNCKR